jgi:hypothetical protein
MHSQKYLFFFGVLLLAAACIAGCASQQAPPAMPARVPHTTVAAPEPTAPPATAAPTAPVTLSPGPSATEPGTVIFEEMGTISPETYNTYEFRTMGEPLLKLGSRYKISIRADKPVLGYAVTTYQADQLGGDLMTPHYAEHSDKIQWGLAEPIMVMEKVTDDTRTFMVDRQAMYSYVIDGRWMQSVDVYKTSPPFHYTLTITKL